MLDTINNMLATHSAISQRENRAVDLDKKSNDKFSDQLNAAESPAPKERSKPEQTSGRGEDDQAAAKQDSDKPARNDEAQGSSEKTSDDGAPVVAEEEKEVSFETALLLLNEIQDGVEEGVEFIQAPAAITAQGSQQNSGDEEALLAQLAQGGGDEQIVELASHVTGEGEEGEQAGLQTALSGEGDVVVEENAGKNGQELAQTGPRENGAGQEKKAAVTPLQRIVEDNVRKTGDADKGAETASVSKTQEGEGLFTDAPSADGDDLSGDSGEQKNQPRIANVQANAAFKGLQGLHNSAAQADTGIGALQQTQVQTAASQFSITQGLGTAQQNPQVPLNNLAMHIAGQAQAGNKRFDIMLDPPELGRIEVRLDVSKEGAVSTQIFVERSETLDLMQRDSRALEKALNDAGLDMKEGNLEFSLKEEGFQGEGMDDDASASSSGEDDDGDIALKDINLEQVMNMYGRNGGPLGLDIRV